MSRRLLWLPVALAGAVWLGCCFVPSLELLLTGTIGGGDGQQLFRFVQPLALVPGMLPWSVAYVAGGAAVLIVSALALAGRAPRYGPLLAFLAGAAATLHLATLGAWNPHPTR